MSAYADTLLARERMARYEREADRDRLAKTARSARRDAAERRRGEGVDVRLMARELRRIVLRRLLGEAATV
jgi:hypothetical protein